MKMYIGGIIMKKGIAIMLMILTSISLLASVNIKGEANQKSIAKKVIRFHVIANSDTVEDQTLKLKVRDEVLKYISPKLKFSKDINESRKILKDNDEKIKKIALKTIKDNGYAYDVNTTLRQDNFPIKQYGNIILPEGTYEAYRIVIGTGNGHNWWCVMFPPLCFVDITKGEVSDEKTKKEMKQVLTKDEYKIVDKTKNEQNNKIKMKFKVVETFKNIFK